ncbi:MAG: hypothetical protein EP330_12660, partial [Deltaproteobacteria bacterium]
VEPAPVVPKPVAPRPAPVEVAPEPTPAPKPAPTQVGSVTFVLEPSSLTVETAGGAVANRRAIALPVGPQLVRVTGGDDPWECTVPVREGHSQYVVRQSDHACVPSR